MPHGTSTPLSKQLREVLLGLGCNQPLVRSSQKTSHDKCFHQFRSRSRLTHVWLATRHSSTITATVERDQRLETDGLRAHGKLKNNVGHGKFLDHGSSVHNRDRVVTRRNQFKSWGQRHAWEIDVDHDWVENVSHNSALDKTISEFDSLGNVDQGSIEAAELQANGSFPDNHVLHSGLHDETDLNPTTHTQFFPTGPETSHGTSSGETTSLRGLLDSITRRQVQHGHGEEVAVSLVRLTHHERLSIARLGYTIRDVMTWIGILSSRDSVEAASRLITYCRTAKLGDVPAFLWTYPLSYRHVRPRTLLLITRLCDELSSQAPCLGQETRSSILNVLFEGILVARTISPRALPNFVPPLLRLTEHPIGAEIGITQMLRNTSFTLNRALRLISLPTRVAPLINTKYQEEAIVLILQHMANQKPALQIDREGYRAVIRMQLTMPKTPDERRWGSLKALSWPPWKEDRTGIDTEFGLEHGTSRAGETLRQMQQAGYALGGWEKVASIYAGWDVDGTPTIQTRRTLGGAIKEYGNEAAIWSARINVTRTIQEAWACFLAYEDSKLPPHVDVYLETLRKLFQEGRRIGLSQRKKRNNEHSLESSQLLAGDARENLPLPPSTHLHTYTRIPPPTMDGFFWYLQEKEIELDDRCLAFVVGNAPSLQHGMDYLLKSTLGTATLETVLSATSSKDVESISKPLLHAIIRLLCRYSNASFKRFLPEKFNQLHYRNWNPHGAHPLRPNPNNAMVQVLRLLELSDKVFPPTWNVVLAALAKETASCLIRFGANDLNRYHLSHRAEYERSVAFASLKRVVSLMRQKDAVLDRHGFVYVCYAFENIAIACFGAVERHHNRYQYCTSGKKEDLVWENIRTFKPSLHRTFLQSTFDRLVGYDHISTGGRPDDSMPCAHPPLLHTPDPTLLHSYTRALGWLGCHDDISKLVRWMERHRVELSEQIARRRNGESMMRRTIVAIRVFLERAWFVLDDQEYTKVRRDKSFLHQLPGGAPKELIEEVKTSIEKVGEWGGWPRNEEVEEYCRDGKFARFNRKFEESDDSEPTRTKAFEL